MANHYILRHNILSPTVWTTLLLGFSMFVSSLVYYNIELIIAAQSFPDFLAVPLSNEKEMAVVRLIVAAVVGFFSFFLLAYIYQAIIDGIRTSIIIKQLKQNISNNRGDLQENCPDPDAWAFYPLFTSIWHDYIGSLQRQTIADDQSGSPIKTYRATLSAQHFFNTRALVDIPQKVDFFRHLPGILTGLGIIGTFAGVLLGLVTFDPSVPASKITEQLSNLFEGVSTAFIASFFAISCAVIITTLEKFILQWRYAQVSMCHTLLNRLYKIDAGKDLSQDLIDCFSGYLPLLANKLEHGAPTSESLVQLDKTTSSEHHAQPPALAEALSELSATFRKDQTVFLQQFEHSVDQRLSHLETTLAKNLESLYAQQSGTIATLPNSFAEGISALSNILNDFAGTISNKISNGHADSRAATNDLIAAISDNKTHDANRLAEHELNLSQHFSNAIKHETDKTAVILNNLLTSNNELANTLQANLQLLNDTFAKTSSSADNTLLQITDELGSHAQKQLEQEQQNFEVALQHQDENSALQRKQLIKMVHAMVEQSDNNSEQHAKQFQETTKTISQRINDTINTSNQYLNKKIDQQNQQNEKITGQFTTQLSTQLHAFVQKLSAEQQAIADDLRGAINTFSQTNVDREQAQQQLNATLLTVSDQLTQQIATTDAAHTTNTTHLQMIQELIGALTSNYTTNHAELQTILTHIDKIMGAQITHADQIVVHAELLSQAIQPLQQQAEAIGQNIANIATAGDKTNLAVTGLSEQIQRNIDAFSGALNGQIDAFANTQREHSQEMTDNLLNQIGKLNEPLEQNTKQILNLEQEITANSKNLTTELAAQNHNSTAMLSKTFGTLINTTIERNAVNAGELNQLLTQQLNDLTTAMQQNTEQAKVLTAQTGQTLQNVFSQFLTQNNAATSNMVKTLHSAITDTNKQTSSSTQQVADMLGKHLLGLKSEMERNTDQSKALANNADQALQKFVTDISGQNNTATTNIIETLQAVITDISDQNLHSTQNISAKLDKNLANLGVVVEHNTAQTKASTQQAEKLLNQLIINLTEQNQLMADELAQTLQDNIAKLSGESNDLKSVIDTTVKPALSRTEVNFKQLFTTIAALTAQISDDKAVADTALAELTHKIVASVHAKEATILQRLDDFRAGVATQQTEMHTSLQDFNKNYLTEISSLQPLITKSLTANLAKTEKNILKHANDVTKKQSNDLLKATKALFAQITTKLEEEIQSLIARLLSMAEVNAKELDSMKNEFGSWVDELAQSNQAEAKLLLDSFERVIAQTEAKQDGTIQILIDFTNNLNSDFGQMKEAFAHLGEDVTTKMQKKLQPR